MLAHPLLQSPIEFKENRVPVLIVENGQLFRRLIGDLLAQENGEPGEFALSENAGLTEIGNGDNTDNGDGGSDNTDNTGGDDNGGGDGDNTGDNDDGGDSGGGSAGENGGMPCRIE